MTIDVDGFFRVHADQSFDFTDEIGFSLGGTAPSLVNEGALSLTVTTDAPEPIALVYAPTDNALIWNRGGASMRLNEAAGATVGSGIFTLNGANQLVRNDGEIHIASGDSILAMLSGGASLRLVNNGDFHVTAVDGASLGLIREDAQIVNSGVIHVHAADARGIGILGGSAEGAGLFRNSGLFHVSGEGAFALNLRDAVDGYRVQNSGAITAHADGADATSIALYLPSFSSGRVVIDNSA